MKLFKIFQKGLTKKSLVKNKINIIMILVDGVRLDRARKFPNFQGFFDKGTLFSNMITYAPYTIASMYSIFTGTYGSQNGVNNYYGALSYKKEEFKTITEYLKEMDFFTFGDSLNKIVLPEYGFDRLVIQDEDYNCLEKHNIFLDQAKQCTERDKNFFLFLHYRCVHDNLVNEVFKKFTDDDKNYFGNENKNLERYDSFIKMVDDYLGEIYKKIEKLGLFENSIVILFSDHGASVGEKIGERIYGNFCYDYTLKMFSLFIFPDLFPIKESKNLTRGIDIMPTILEICGIKNKCEIKGKSLIPIIEDKEKMSRIAFSETGGLAGPYPSPKYPNVKSIRTQNWKLIYNVTPGTKELYHLAKDPLEINNLFGQKLVAEKKLLHLLNNEMK